MERKKSNLFVYLSEIIEWMMMMIFFAGLGSEKDCWEEVCRQKIRELEISLFLTTSRKNELNKKASKTRTYCCPVCSFMIIILMSCLANHQRHVYVWNETLMNLSGFNWKFKAFVMRFLKCEVLRWLKLTIGWRRRRRWRWMGGRGAYFLFYRKRSVTSLARYSSQIPSRLDQNSLLILIQNFVLLSKQFEHLLMLFRRRK